MLVGMRKSFVALRVHPQPTTSAAGVLTNELVDDQVGALCEPFGDSKVHPADGVRIGDRGRGERTGPKNHLSSGAGLADVGVHRGPSAPRARGAHGGRYPLPSPRRLGEGCAHA